MFLSAAHMDRFPHNVGCPAGLPLPVTTLPPVNTTQLGTPFLNLPTGNLPDSVTMTHAPGSPSSAEAPGRLTLHASHAGQATQLDGAPTVPRLHAAWEFVQHLLTYHAEYRLCLNILPVVATLESTPLAGNS